MQTAYLDNSATTRPCAAAVEAIADALQVHWHNPSSLYEPGIEAKQRLEQARRQVATALGAEPTASISPPAAPRPTTGPSSPAPAG